MCPGIYSQEGGSVRQPYLSYRPARLLRLAKSIPGLHKRLQIRALSSLPSLHRGYQMLLCYYLRTAQYSTINRENNKIYCLYLFIASFYSHSLPFYRAMFLFLLGSYWQRRDKPALNTPPPPPPPTPTRESRDSCIRYCSCFPS